MVSKQYEKLYVYPFYQCIYQNNRNLLDLKVVICDPEVCLRIHYFLGVSKFADIRDSFKHSQVEQIQIFPEVLLLFPDFQMEDIQQLQSNNSSDRKKCIEKYGR